MEAKALPPEEVIRKKNILDVQMIEYQQLYEHIRHDDNLISKSKVFFISISFAILAYSIGQDLSTYDLICASFASMAIIIYCAILVRRLEIKIYAKYEAIRSIEKQVNENLGSNAINFQSNYNNFVWEGQSSWSIRSIKTRHAVWMIGVLLTALWTFRIFI